MNIEGYNVQWMPVGASQAAVQIYERKKCFLCVSYWSKVWESNEIPIEMATQKNLRDIKDWYARAFDSYKSCKTSMDELRALRDN